MFDSIILIENKLISRITITEKYSSLHYSKTMLKMPEGAGGSCRILVLKLTFVIIIIMIVMMIIIIIIIIIALIEIISQPFLANDHRLPP